METFRLIHLSDLHLASEARRLNATDEFSLCHFFKGKWSMLSPTSYDQEIAEQVCRVIFELANMNDDGIDFVVITGDLATTGREDDLITAYALVDAPSSTGAPWLADNGFPTLDGSHAIPPVFVVPGNHDRYKDGYLFPGGNNFDRVFQKYWPGEKVVHCEIRKNYSPECLHLILCDFTLEDDRDGDPPIGYMGQGRVYEDTLKKLVAVTEDIGAPRINNIIWGMHFTPLHDKSSLKLIDHESLVKAAEKLRVNLLLSGHIHDLYKATKSSVEINATGSATIFTLKDENTFSYFEVDVNKNEVLACRRCDYRWDRTVSDFIKI